MVARILMVDDEPRVLDALRRTLGAHYAIAVADSGAAALEAQRTAADAGDPFWVIVSDMMMPGMNGAQFLTAARRFDPDVVALVLSGQADLDSTIHAVNEAGLFGFLTKPCPPESLTRALDRAIAQYELVQAERELLERTVRGAVDLLTELMAGTSPHAFAHGTRIKDLVAAAAEHLDLQRDWQLPLAARLSQLGCLGIPDDLLERAYHGEQLGAEDERIFRGHPSAGESMLERIPRLETVARWVGSQPLVPQDPVPQDAGPEQVLFCAAAATVAAFEVTGDAAAAVGMVQSLGHYEARTMAAISAARGVLRSAGRVRQLGVDQLRAGMTLDQDVVTTSGMPLVRKGEPVTETLLVRLHNFAASVGIPEPIRVIDFDGSPH